VVVNFFRPKIVNLKNSYVVFEFTVAQQVTRATDLQNSSQNAIENGEVGCLFKQIPNN